MRNRLHSLTMKINSQRSFILLGAGLAVGLISTLPLRAEDWPQWRGPSRTGISRETGWVAQWPANGPKKLWEGFVGVGYASVAVSQGRLYTMGNVQEKDYVYCLDAETGKPLWNYGYDCSSKDPNKYFGTRCTPTLDGNRAYTLSRQGHFFCLDAQSGRVLWSKDFKKDFGGEVPTWGFAGSPWIEQDWVLTETGSPSGASVVALDKITGAVVWKNGNDPAGYASIIAFDLAGERCFIQFSKDHVIGRRMKDGAELWRTPWATSYGVNAATPIILGDQVFMSSGYGFGCARMRMSTNEVTDIWRNKNMRNHVNSCVLLNGYLYGYDENQLRCLDWQTGEVKWATGDYGKGALVYADGKLILYGQTGKLGVAECSPEAFKPISSFKALAGQDTWAPPVLANGRIYVRSQAKLAAFDVKAK